jgi:hypothetical protein
LLLVPRLCARCDCFLTRSNRIRHRRERRRLPHEHMGNRMHVNLLVGVVGAVLSIFLVFQFGPRLIYDYRITDCGIDIVLFHGLPIWRIPFDDIESVRIASWKELNLGFTILRLGNRFTSRYLAIKKRGGWFRTVAITPADAEKFASQIPVSGPQHAAERR